MSSETVDVPATHGTNSFAGGLLWPRKPPGSIHLVVSATGEEYRAQGSFTPVGGGSCGSNSTPVGSSSHNLLLEDEHIVDVQLSSRTATHKKLRNDNAFVPQEDLGREREHCIEAALAAPRLIVGTSGSEGLRKLCWTGIPQRYRAEAWKLLLGYTSPMKERREKELARKRAEYREYVTRYYRARDGGTSAGGHQSGNSSMGGHTSKAAGPTTEHDAILHQLGLDLPRHSQALFHIPRLRERLEQVLYVWSVRHPAIGYVQGIDDLTYVFFVLFLSEALGISLEQASTSDVATLTARVDPNQMTNVVLDGVEADVYWCASAFLSHVQDLFTFNQPGIVRMTMNFSHLVSKLAPGVFNAIDANGISFDSFCIEWMHCLLVRQLPFPLLLRLWDTYVCEGAGFPSLHVFVCASLLLHWKHEIVGMDMEQLMSFLKRLPTEQLQEVDLEAMVANAFVLQHQHQLPT